MRGQRRHLGGRLRAAVDGRVDLVVGVAERHVLDGNLDPPIWDVVQFGQAGFHRAGGSDGPVELRHVPGCARVFLTTGRGNGFGCDAVGLDVVGVAVAALRVVGDDDVRAQLPDDRDEFADGLVHIGVAEPLPVPRRRSRHPRVAPVTRTAEKYRFADPESAQSGYKFAYAVAAQLVGGVHSQLRVALADDFTLFAERAGDDVDLGAAPGVVGDRDPVIEGLVVRMCVHEEQPRSLHSLQLARRRWLGSATRWYRITISGWKKR